MASIDLRERFIGKGYVGTISSEPALSWLDREALSATAAATQSIAGSLGSLSLEIAASIGWGTTEISSAILHMEEELGFHLSQQTALLTEQLEALERIDSALRHPAKVRAAERLADAAQLLRAKRFERTLPLAEEAIAADPLNPSAFSTAAWALLGLERLPEAREMFAEAALAADGDNRARFTRHEARVAFALGYGEAAVAALVRILSEAITDVERAAVLYDLCVFEAEDDPVRAADCLGQAASHDSRYALMALVDPLLADHQDLLDLAHARLIALRTEYRSALDELRLRVAKAREADSASASLNLVSRAALAKVITEIEEIPAESHSPHAQIAVARQLAASLDSALARVLREIEDTPRIEELERESEGLIRAISLRQSALEVESERLEQHKDELFSEMHRIVNSPKRRKLHRKEEELRSQWKRTEQQWIATRAFILNRNDPTIVELNRRLTELYHEIKRLKYSSLEYLT
jgi:tetratricopeptide (TPR) repeat protein